MKDFIEVMKALSEPNRLKTLKILQRRALCVCEIRQVLGIAEPTVSNHLKVLEDAGLVTCQRDGLRANYRLTDGSSTSYAASLLGFLKHWLEDAPEVAQLIKRAATVSRGEL